MGLETAIGSVLEEAGTAETGLPIFPDGILEDLAFFPSAGALVDLVDLVCFVFMRQAPACGLPVGFCHREGLEKQAGEVFCQRSTPGRRFGQRVWGLER